MMDSQLLVITEKVVSTVNATVAEHHCCDDGHTNVCAEPTVEVDTVNVSAPQTELAADATQTEPVEVVVDVSEVTVTENTEMDAEDDREEKADATAEVENEHVTPMTPDILSGEIGDDSSSESAGGDIPKVARTAETCVAELPAEGAEQTEVVVAPGSEDATEAGYGTANEIPPDLPADTEKAPARGSNGSEAGTPSPPTVDDTAEKTTASKKRQRSVSFSNVVTADSPNLGKLC